MNGQGKAKLLIVDDDVGTVRLLSAIVQDFGDIFFATHGREAVERVRQLRPDIVLLDAEMPGMDGFAVCAAIKDDADFADLPVLFVTAHDDVILEARALDLGAVDFISKPISAAIVRARVRTHLALKQRTDELRRLVGVDGLTGIANRRTFDAALHQEWRRACRSRAPMSVMLIDVDHFKQFNDHYGHQLGDDCLRAVAAALAAGCHRSGELMARYGGEEFAAVIPACAADSALRLAEQLRGRVLDLGLPHAGAVSARQVTVSVGVASAEFAVVTGLPAAASSTPVEVAADDPPALAGLVAAADRALYQAKQAGRNRVAGRTCLIGPADRLLADRPLAGVP